MADYFSLGLLSVLLLGSNVFWAKHCAKLTDKLMSRNFADYISTEKYRTTAKAKTSVTVEDEDVIDPRDASQAQQLNSIMGMV